MQSVHTLTTTTLFAISLANESLESVTTALITHLRSANKLQLVATPNPEQVMLAQRQPDFLRTLSQFDICLPDGSGLVWASHFLQSKPGITERIAGIDVTSSLLTQTLAQHESVLIIGGRGYAGQHIVLPTRGQGGEFEERVTITISAVASTAELANAKKIAVHGGVFALDGYVNAAHPHNEEDAWIQEVLGILKPSLVCVAFGAPQQEEWLLAWRARLEKSGVKIGITVGGAFDMLLGRIPRAPLSWQKAHLEWLWRLIHEPWRWRRQLALLSFIVLVAKRKFDSLTQ